jgi:hypothetical protein
LPAEGEQVEVTLIPSPTPAGIETRTAIPWNWKRFAGAVRDWRRQVGQGQFFYAFDLDKVMPPDHLVRQIDDVLDLSWVHKEPASSDWSRRRPHRLDSGAQQTTYSPDG